MRRLAVVVMLLAIAACSSHRPPNPQPTPPAPTPTPPPSGTVPPKGVPQNPERLLRNEANQYLRTNDGKRFDPFMCVACCMGWEKVGNQYWPNAGIAFQDACGAYGANMFHFRLGPWIANCTNADDPHCGETEWAAIGGAYLPGTFDWNPAYWDAVREQVWHAHVKGRYSEVVPIDSWYLKACAQHTVECAWPPDQYKVGPTLTREQERLARKSVEEVGCIGSVVWTTGNEEDLAPGMNADWLNDFVRIVRDEETKTGCNFVHMIGTGSFKDGVSADYQITHSTSPVTGNCNGRWCENNEHNPAWSPEQEASYFNQARAAGQSWAAWRAESSDADWEKRLELFSKIAGGGGSDGVGCFAPGPDDPLWNEPPLTPAQRAPMMMAALNEAKARVGDRCGATAPCDHEPTPDAPCAPPVHLGCLETNGLVAAELRKMGYCASGPWTDATAILAPDTYWEEMHVCSTGNGCYTGNPYLKAWKYNGTNPTPPAECPVVTCSVSEILFKLHQPGQGLWDGTPKCPDGQPVLPEGDPHRAACEKAAMGGAWPTYHLEGTGISLELVENPMQFKITGSGSGVVTCVVPASAGKNLCKAGDTTVEQGVPVAR